MNRQYIIQVDRLILNYLADRQGHWTCLWDGSFKGKEDEILSNGERQGFVDDVYYAMPESVSPNQAIKFMRGLYLRGMVGGCPCGCRGDWEITDKGLWAISRKRVKKYIGYSEIEWRKNQRIYMMKTFPRAPE